MVYIIMSADIHGTPKFDSVYSDLDMAKARYIYLKNVCLESEAKLLETKIVTAEMKKDDYIPGVKRILPVPHPRVN